MKILNKGIYKFNRAKESQVSKNVLKFLTFIKLKKF